jgi:hypothetical protein
VNNRRYSEAWIGGIFALLAAAVGGSAPFWSPQVFGTDASQRSADASTPPAVTPAPATPSTVPAANPAPLTGRFQGAAQQDDAGVRSQYRMNITLHPAAIGQPAGTSHYDVQSGSCEGRLTLTQRSSDGTTAQLTEAITTGGCIPYGTVKVTVTSATEVFFEYWGTLHDGGTEYVHATLDRVG